MDSPHQIIREFLRCPRCAQPLGAGAGDLACEGDATHRFRSQEGILTFAESSPGKYEDEYAARYAGLWAYGYATVHSGQNEPLYRSVASLAAEVLAGLHADRTALVVDSGCGVGRVAADCARLHPRAQILGFDGSPAMLRCAKNVVLGTQDVTFDLSKFGFGALSMPAIGATNVHLLRADVEQLPLVADCADLALSVNIVDRLAEGPERALRECHRVLKRGGSLVFTDPMNWTTAQQWRELPNGTSLLRMIESCGFDTVTWYDDLLYRELLDARGSVEEFRTLVVHAKKP